MLHVAGSLTLGEVRGYDPIRMLSRDGRPTGLGDAFAHYGRIFKTLHLLQFISDQGYRRMIGAQLNVTEARHCLARLSPLQYDHINFFGMPSRPRPHRGSARYATRTPKPTPPMGAERTRVGRGSDVNGIPAHTRDFTPACSGAPERKRG